MSTDAQRRWSTLPIRDRLKILKNARHRMAAMPQQFAAAISPALHRNAADTLSAELLPLLDACRFLERKAALILQPRVLGSAGRPSWLRGVTAKIQRDPLGHILVIGPSNFPLFLPGVQVLQALAAGNSATWKPGSGGREVALLVAGALHDAGLPQGLLKVTFDTVDATGQALAEAPDKVIFTGSAETGKAILARLSETTTPAVVELSGADAVIVLPSANLSRVAKAIAFGLRLNGGAVCMSPRRLLATVGTMTALLPRLERELANVPPTTLSQKSAATLSSLLDQAIATGATLHGEWNPAQQRPLLVANALPTMQIASTDVFAPFLSLLSTPTTSQLPAVYAECPYALTVSIFGDEREALSIANNLLAGTVLINDLIVPTADPRISFGGRADSGYGSTRGAEGLLEMTAPRTTLVQRSNSVRHWLPTSDTHTRLFESFIRATHGATWPDRLKATMKTITAARNLKK